jgi:hypothetical protein
MTYKIASAERAAVIIISLITNANCVRQVDPGARTTANAETFLVMQGNHSQRQRRLSAFITAPSSYQPPPP